MRIILDNYTRLSNIFGLIERILDRIGPWLLRSITFSLMIFLWLPMFTMVISSFSQTLFSFPPTSLTTDWYVEFLTNDQAISAIITSLQIGALATPVSVILAVLYSYGFNRYSFRGQRFLQIILILPLVVPLVITGTALTLFFGLLEINPGFWPVVIAHIIWTVPFTTLVVLPSFIRFNPRLEEASMDLGASELETFRSITFPNVLPGIIAGAVLAFTLSLNEFIFTFFVRDSTTRTLPVFLWNKIRFGLTPEINAISTLFLISAIIFILIFISVTRIERLL